MKAVFFKSLIILFATLTIAVVAMGIYIQHKKSQYLVIISEPNIQNNYPHQYKPIQFLKYTQKGLWDEKDLPKNYFAKPYSLPPKPPQKKQWRLVAVGDIMVHADLQLGASLHRNDPQETSGGYDWVINNVTNLFSGADVVMGNLETPITPHSPRSGYPRFNADPILLDSLKKAGFNVLFVANNHALDHGEEGIFETQKQLEKRGFSYLGTNHPAHDKRDFMMLSIGDFHKIKIAFVNFTFQSNNEPSNDQILHYASLDANRVEKITRSIKAAQKKDAQYIIVFLHWGREYHDMPSRHQREIVKELCLQGANMIIGAGPHVIQPIEMIYSRGGKILKANEAGAREHFIAYSLGNFVSHQRGMPQYGLVLDLTIAEIENSIFLQKAVPHIVKSVAHKEEMLIDGFVRSQDSYQLLEVPLAEFANYVEEN